MFENEIKQYMQKHGFERFAPQTLEGLAGLFVGKSGIFDHQWSARGQAARIYKTEVVREPEKLTRAGDGYCWLKGYAYMLRTDSAKDLIAEIDEVGKIFVYNGGFAEDFLYRAVNERVYLFYFHMLPPFSLRQLPR